MAKVYNIDKELEDAGVLEKEYEGELHREGHGDPFDFNQFVKSPLGNFAVDAAVSAINWATWFKKRFPKQAKGGKAEHFLRYMDDMAYRAGSQGASPYRGNYEIAQAIKDQDEGKSFEGLNYRGVEFGGGAWKAKLDRKGRPAMGSTIDLLHAYIYGEDSSHRKRLKLSKVKPTSWTKEGYDWRSLVESGFKHGVSLGTPTTLHASNYKWHSHRLSDTTIYQDWVEDGIVQFRNKEEAESRDPSEYLRTPEEEIESWGWEGKSRRRFDKFVYEATNKVVDLFMDESGRVAHLDVPWEERHNVSKDFSYKLQKMNVTKETYNDMQQHHKKAYEILYNLTKSGLPQKLTQTNYHQNAFEYLGITNVNTVVNLANYTQSLGYDPEQDAYYLSITDVWDFEPKTYGGMWGSGGMFKANFDRTKRYFMKEQAKPRFSHDAPEEPIVIDVFDENPSISLMMKY